jgi:hypothetical protein
MRGGKRSGTGRKRGVPNKLNAAMRDKLNAGGIAPLEFMLQVMRGTHQDLAVRLEMAKAAAPYLHPRLQAIEHSGKDAESPAHQYVARFVAAPKRENTAPACDTPTSKGFPQLTRESSYPSTERLIT